MIKSNTYEHIYMYVLYHIYTIYIQICMYIYDIYTKYTYINDKI
jgi:hypothetical protein